MHTSLIEYFHDNQRLEGYLAMPNDVQQLRPGVLVVHDWSGRNGFADSQAEQLSDLGYVALAVDMYGDGKTADTVAQKQALLASVVENRLFLRERIIAGFNTLKGVEGVDCHKIAAIGFCFGGLVVLDLARTGMNFSGVVSFHGLLNMPKAVSLPPIHAKILALHGHDDPMVRPDEVSAFCQEMTKANADWQIHIYGKTQHAFTNPLANDSVMGTVYNPQASMRAFIAMQSFLTEIFE